MHLKPTLMLQPCHESYAAILHAFQQGKPLSEEQLNFLLWHARQLSDAHFDPILRDYKIGKSCVHSFLVADELDTPESVSRFREKLEALLREQQHGVMTQFTLSQLNHLIAIEHIPHFIYFDGNRIVVDSPIFRGKKVHACFFKWGNIIGIVRYEVVRDAPLSETHAFVYFAESKKKELTEFIHDFYLKYNADFELIKKQQIMIQGELNKLNLEKELIQREVLEKELLEKHAIVNELPHYEMHSEPQMAQYLAEQSCLQHEKENLDKLVNENLLEEENINYELSEQKRVEQLRSAQEHMEIRIPDLHKNFTNSFSSVFPPRYQLCQ